jgi:hypothetical protein
MPCPEWCVTRHSPDLGEENWLHLGEAVVLDDGIVARLCESIDPESGAQDGPYVLIGTTEYTLREAEHLGASIVALALAGGSARAAYSSRSARKAPSRSVTASLRSTEET